MNDLGTCAECGHLHFIGPNDGYAECPIEGCGCKGQEWARERVCIGWDGVSNPIIRYADELNLPDALRTIPPAA